MEEIKPIGLFAFSCLIACLTQALPDWLIVFSIASVGLSFWRGLRVPMLLLYGLMLASWSLLAFESPGFLHRQTLTGAIVLKSLFSILSPGHKHRIMRFHAALFALLVAILVIPKEPYPIWLYLSICLLVCSSLVFHHVQARSLFSLISIGGKLLKLALPITLLILPVYFFFPEIRSQSQYKGSSGMSGDLEPGKLASLALSDRLAFRVHFRGAVPTRDHLYWRVDVLEKSEGLKWSQGSVYPNRSMPSKAPNEGIIYELMLDRQLKGMAPLLEHTTSISGPREGGDLMWQAEKQILRTENSYLVAAATVTARFSSVKPPKLPEIEATLSPRVKALVARLGQKTAEDRITTLLSLFRGFRYTLRPGRLVTQDPLDEFLFEAQQGYCEHFAASFATLLRLSGTPVRIVVGYQGGIQLGKTSYFQITNASAHAWTEVWLNGEWRRIDPSSVAIHDATREQDRYSLSALATAWLGFSMQSILNFIRDWSEDIDWIWLGIGIAATGLTLVQVYRLRHRGETLPAWEARIKKFLPALEDLGFVRADGETVLTYLNRVGQQTSFQALEELAALYNICKFAEDAKAVPELERTLRRCKAALPAFIKQRKKSSRSRLTV